MVKFYNSLDCFFSAIQPKHSQHGGLCLSQGCDYDVCHRRLLVKQPQFDLDGKRGKDGDRLRFTSGQLILATQCHKEIVVQDIQPSKTAHAQMLEAWSVPGVLTESGSNLTFNQISNTQPVVKESNYLRNPVLTKGSG